MQGVEINESGNNSSETNSLSSTILIDQIVGETIEETSDLSLDVEGVSNPGSETSENFPEGGLQVDNSLGKFEILISEMEQVSALDPDSSVSIPSLAESRIEPPSGLTLTRVSSNAHLGVTNGRGRHQYSKRQAWNSDESIIMVGESLIDADNYEVLVQPIPMSSARNWSNTDSDLMYGIQFNPDPNNFVSWNVRTNELKLLRRFDGFVKCSLGNGEGNISNNDQYVVIACNKKSNGAKTLISYDISNDVVLGTLAAKDSYNWVGVSQTGEYILVENNKYPDPVKEILRYDLEFGSEKSLGSRRHGDFGIDDQGRDVYAMIRHSYIFYVRLVDGERFILPISDDDNPIGSGHLSCRNLNRPGWCYYSAYKDTRLGSVKISDSDSTVQEWGFHRSSSDEYVSQPHVTPSPSGTKILFASDWYGRDEISSYSIVYD